ncbi:MAG: hypothetical protein IH948_07890 [Bacteroidetes bacterium]|nr:hypothetical protein [Bacteroidota bacterium]
MLPIKDEDTGDWVTIEKRVEAEGTVLVVTTTLDRIHHENQTRLFDLFIDESEKQTSNILLMQASQMEKDDPGIDNEIRIWRAAQTILEGYIVYIPFATELAKAFPKFEIRSRRDFARLLNLIRSHTLLYQYQRNIDDRGRLIATVADLEAILAFAEIILAQSMKAFTPKQEKSLKIIQHNFNEDEFSVKELSRYTESITTYRTLQRYCNYFSKEGLLDWNGVKGAGSRYRLNSSLAQLGNSSIFPPNLLETLRNNYDKSDQHTTGAIGANNGNNANNDISCQKDNDVIKSNDIGQLGNENTNYANYDKERDWEEQVNDFLS